MIYNQLKFVSCWYLCTIENNMHIQYTRTPGHLVQDKKHQKYAQAFLHMLRIRTVRGDLFIVLSACRGEGVGGRGGREEPVLSCRKKRSSSLQDRWQLVLFGNFFCNFAWCIWDEPLKINKHFFISLMAKVANSQFFAELIT